MNAVTKAEPQSRALALEQVLISGDLAKLTPDQRVEYYHKVCESTGLNPLTQPFSYITLNGKLTLYALRACTDQLRQIHNISVDDMTETERDGVCIVTVKVRNSAGRTDMSKGAVHLVNLKGEALANAIMKAETKAKRRATLSICGLALLDELEVDTIPNARPVPTDAKVLTPPPAPRTELTEEEQRAIDREGMRDMAHETLEPPPYDPETGEIIEPDPVADPIAEKAIDWGKHAIELVRKFSNAAAFNRWYMLASNKANIAALGKYDKGLQNILVEEITAADDKWNPPK